MIKLLKIIFLGLFFVLLQGCFPWPSDREQCIETTSGALVLCGPTLPNATQAEKIAADQMCLFVLIEYNKCYDRSDTPHYTPWTP